LSRRGSQNAFYGRLQDKEDLRLCEMKEFMESNYLSFPALLDTNQEVALEYNMRGIPTTFFIDKDGIIQDMEVGAFRSVVEIEASLRKIMP